MGGKSGDYARAIRLFAEAESAETFARAVALTEGAAAGGDADATAMLATIEAVGAGRPRNWQRALDLLPLAARRGSDHARRQLELLDGRSPEELLVPPPRTPLASQPMLSVFEGFASPAECRWVIERMLTDIGFVLESVDYHAPLHGTYLLRKPKPDQQS